MLSFRQYRGLPPINESAEALNYIFKDASKEIDKIVDAWLQALIQELSKKPSADTQRNLWDRFRNAVSNLVYGRYDPKNPYYNQNLYGDVLGSKSKNESTQFISKPFKLAEYKVFKEIIDGMESVFLEADGTENLRLMNVLKQHADKLKSALKTMLQANMQNITKISSMAAAPKQAPPAEEPRQAEPAAPTAEEPRQADKTKTKRRMQPKVKMGQAEQMVMKQRAQLEKLKNNAVELSKYFDKNEDLRQFKTQVDQEVENLDRMLSQLNSGNPLDDENISQISTNLKQFEGVQEISGLQQKLKTLKRQIQESKIRESSKEELLKKLSELEIKMRRLQAGESSTREFNQVRSDLNNLESSFESKKQIGSTSERTPNVVITPDDEDASSPSASLADENEDDDDPIFRRFQASSSQKSEEKPEQGSDEGSPLKRFIARQSGQEAQAKAPALKQDLPYISKKDSFEGEDTGGQADGEKQKIKTSKQDTSQIQSTNLISDDKINFEYLDKLVQLLELDSGKKKTYIEEIKKLEKIWRKIANEGKKKEKIKFKQRYQQMLDDLKFKFTIDGKEFPDDDDNDDDIEIDF